MYAILIQLQNGELKDPFLQAPDHGALTKINQLDPGLSVRTFFISSDGNCICS